MIASIRFISPESTASCAAPAIWLAPGIICRSWPIGPIFLIWSSWLRKSSSVKRFSIIRFAVSSASAWSTFSWTRSTKRQDVAHAEDALGEPIRMERLEAVGPLAGAEERDRQAGRRANAERRAAARVAVHLGQDEPGDRQAWRGRPRPRGPTPGRSSRRPRAASRTASRAPVMRTSSSIIASSTWRRPAVSRIITSTPRWRPTSSPERATSSAGRADRAGVDLDPDLVAELDELVDGRGSVDVGGDEERLLALLAQPDRQLRGGRRLSRALEADHHQDRLDARRAAGGAARRRAPRPARRGRS